MEEMVVKVKKVKLASLKFGRKANKNKGKGKASLVTKLVEHSRMLKSQTKIIDKMIQVLKG